MTRSILIALAVLSGAATAQAAGFDCSKWQKNDDGSWSAKEPIEIGGPAGRLDYMPGEIYKEGDSKNGLDIAKLLNANCSGK